MLGNDDSDGLTYRRAAVAFSSALDREVMSGDLGAANVQATMAVAESLPAHDGASTAAAVTILIRAVVAVTMVATRVGKGVASGVSDAVGGDGRRLGYGAKAPTP